MEATDPKLSAQTKDRFATDASANVPGDIQVIRGRGQVVDAFEVTANRWFDREKVRQAAAAIESYGLSRVTILGKLDNDTPLDILSRLHASGLPAHIDPDRLNIQVLDLRSTLQTLAALIPTVGGIAAALRFAYEFIRTISDTQHAKRFVDVCRELGFTE
jgi:hypothetical protein